MALRHTQIDDFVAATLNEVKTGKWTDLSLEHQEYISATLITEKRVVESGAAEIEFVIQTKNTGNARNTGLYATDVTNVEDILKRGKTGWSKQTTNFSYDIDEPLFQSDRETIVEEIVVRDHSAQNDMVVLNEENLWSMPVDSDDPRPCGVPYWIVKDATTTPGGGFNGGNPTGHAAGAAAVDSSKYPGWRNWAFGYDAVTTNDLIKKVKKALAFTNFMAPVPHPELGFGKSDYNIFTTYRVTEESERLAESRNDNLGSDLARYANAVTIAGVPMKFVPYLEANDTSDPLYGVNWKSFRPYVKKGASMRRSLPKERDTQHTVRTVYIDNWMNYVCYNRRLNWVGSKAA